MNEGMILIDDECVEMLFFDTLLNIDFSSMTKTSFECF